MPEQPVPEGYHTLTPYLAVDDASAAIDFYKRAFGANERSRMAGPDGMIAHAEIEIGDSVLMLSDPFPQATTRPPKELGGTSSGLFVYVDDVDEAFRRAVDTGATSVSEPEDMFWGDRFGTVTDPFGHSWQLAQRIEEVPPEELERRAEEWMSQMAAAHSA